MDSTKYQGGLLIILLLVCWQIVVSANILSTIFIASPQEIILALLNLLIQGKLWTDIAFTSWRTLIAFTLSLVLGTPLGIAIGYFRKVGYSTELLFDFLRSLPPIALFPLFLFFFGIGDASKIAVASFMGILIVTVAAIQGTKQIKRTRLLLAKKMGLKGWNLFFKFLLPESLPAIFSGYRMAAPLCLILIIVTEMFLGGQVGLGSKLIDAQMLYNIAELYALIAISGLMGYSLNIAFMKLENKIIHWRTR